MASYLKRNKLGKYNEEEMADLAKQKEQKEAGGRGYVLKKKGGSGNSDRGTFAHACVAKFGGINNLLAGAPACRATPTLGRAHDSGLPPVSNWVEIGLGFATRGLFPHWSVALRHVVHGVARTSINDPESQHHDHTGITAMPIDTTYNTSTDSTIGSATHHEVPIVRRDQCPGTASTPSSFVALEDDMSGARTGDGITTCIAGSSPSTRDQLTFCLVVQRRRDGPPTHHGRQGLLWTESTCLCTMTQ